MAIIAMLALAASFVLGFAALLVIAAIGLIVGIAIWLRIAWIKRRLYKSGAVPGARVDISRPSGQVIDAEYTVVSDDDDDDDTEKS